MNSQISLVIPTARSLARANRQVTIANKALAEIEGKRWIILAARYPDVFVKAISRYYPLDESLIERYKDRWCWEGDLSNNKALPWSEALIERYEDRWGWKSLSGNETLPWSAALIERYSDRWDWSFLSWNGALPWSLVLMEYFSKMGHFAPPLILNELLKNLDRKVIVQILETVFSDRS